MRHAQTTNISQSFINLGERSGDARRPDSERIRILQLMDEMASRTSVETWRCGVVLTPLSQSLESPNPAIKVAAALCVAHLLGQDDSGEVSAQFARVAAEFLNTASQELKLELLRKLVSLGYSSRHTTRAPVEAALNAASRAVIQEFFSISPEIRKKALEFFSSREESVIVPEENFDALVRALDSEHPEVRSTALMLLTKTLGEKIPPIAKITEMLKEERTQKPAVDLLGKLKGAARPAVPTLLQVLPIDKYTDEAMAAIREIGPEDLTAVRATFDRLHKSGKVRALNIWAELFVPLGKLDLLTLDVLYGGVRSILLGSQAKIAAEIQRFCHSMMSLESRNADGVFDKIIRGLKKALAFHPHPESDDIRERVNAGLESVVEYFTPHRSSERLMHNLVMLVEENEGRTLSIAAYRCYLKRQSRSKILECARIAVLNRRPKDLQRTALTAVNELIPSPDSTEILQIFKAACDHQCQDVEEVSSLVRLVVENGMSWSPDQRENARGLLVDAAIAWTGNARERVLLGLPQLDEAA